MVSKFIKTVMVLLLFNTVIYARSYESTDIVLANAQPQARSEVLWYKDDISLERKYGHPQTFNIHQTCLPATQPMLNCSILKTEKTSCAIQSVEIRPQLSSFADHYEVTVSGNVVTETEICKDQSMEVSCTIFCLSSRVA